MADYNGIYQVWMSIIDDVLLPVEEIENIIPENIVLEQNYPNPFNPTTTIKFTVGDAYYASPTHVLLRIYDVLGNELALLVNEQKSPGIYEVEFNSSTLKNISSGIYFYRLQAGEFSYTKKMILLK
ncbi:MAG: T9SS type A sorting domain-containing protein [Ignavibacteriales bacterium]|nr:MAG: T9SS type A sorting domain-containing protein [Ignavibacteriales bacterium]